MADIVVPRVENLPPFPFLLFFGTRSSFAKLAIFFIRACAAALFLSLRAAFLLARSFILLIMACILVKARQTLNAVDSLLGSSSIRLPKLLGHALGLQLLSVRRPPALLSRVVSRSELSYELPSLPSIAFVFASPLIGLPQASGSSAKSTRVE